MEVLLEKTTSFLKVLVPYIVRVPEALALPTLFTKNRPFKLLVDVAMKRPSARKLEVVIKSVTVRAVVKAVVPVPLVPSAKQINLPVVAL